jgi:hypothetical protein
VAHCVRVCVSVWERLTIYFSQRAEVILCCGDFGSVLLSKDVLQSPCFRGPVCLFGHS